MSSTEQSPNKLSQWDALMLESLKAQGWSADELVCRVLAGDNLPRDDSKFQFDYTQLSATAGIDPASFEAAVRDGYRIKFNTLRGIASWILLALGHEAELVTEPGSEAIIAKLDAGQIQRVKAVLSYGWSVSGDDAGPDGQPSIYRIEPLHRS